MPDAPNPGRHLATVRAAVTPCTAAVSPCKVKLLRKPKGVHCPNPDCLGTALRVLANRRPCPGKNVRYLRCTACGTRLKTTETETK